MRWPPWSSKSDNDNQQNQDPSSSVFPRPTSTTNKPSSLVDWTAFIETRTLVPTILLTSGILFGIRFHRRYLRRIPDAPSISPSFLRRRSVFGQVTSVGDGDNFRLFHTPGGRLAGWEWLPWKKVPTNKKDLKDNTVRRTRQRSLFPRGPRELFLFIVDPANKSPTALQIHIRLAGVDAPELAHFGRPEQPFAREAHAWLTGYLLNRRIRAFVYRQDQYNRVVASVFVRRGFDFPHFVGGTSRTKC
ncbi:hypothetical protein N7532_010864 [Penicillium argentinense]|uniref:Probable endonuclease LCL3 n=1 Tax=Penicillium argentinense TaxID=1131581 RepID=A0A9W9EQD2_9EURO|nr:uncharacterized protein N7532_010864 [Penicillium argentinense]KAJ5086093.1 hypothetical protein N7532_010864 [Penicillium argentinense]